MTSSRRPDPWKDFKAHHPEPPRAGKGTLILAVVFVMVLCGGAGAFLGALWNPGPRRTRIERLARDTTERMTVRAVIGGVVGAGAGLLLLWKGWKGRGEP